MKIRIGLIALFGAASFSAWATTGFTAAPTEAGGAAHSMPASATREAVIREMLDWKRNPVTADGWQIVGGEAGAVFVGVTGQSANARAFGGTASPAARMASGGAPEGTGGAAAGRHIHR